MAKKINLDNSISKRESEWIPFSFRVLNQDVLFPWRITVRFSYKDEDGQLTVESHEYGFASSFIALIQWWELRRNPDVLDIALIAERTHQKCFLHMKPESSARSTGLTDIRIDEAKTIPNDILLFADDPRTKIKLGG